MLTHAIQLHGEAWNTIYFLLKMLVSNTMNNFNPFINKGIINLLEQIINPVKQITNLVVQIINPVEQITNLVEQIINPVDQITNPVEQIINLLEQIKNRVFSFWD